MDRPRFLAGVCSVASRAVPETKRPAKNARTSKASSTASRPEALSSLPTHTHPSPTHPQPDTLTPVHASPLRIPSARTVPLGVKITPAHDAAALFAPHLLALALEGLGGDVVVRQPAGWVPSLGAVVSMP